MKHRALLLAGLALAALVLFGTLLPASTSDSTAWHLHFDAADGVRNVLLFLPIGALLAALGLRPRTALLLSLAFTAGIETAQMWVPGRYPGPGDVLTNTLGSALGIAGVRTSRLWLQPRAGQWKWFQLASGAGAALVLGISGALFQPVTPGPTYHCDHRPSIPGMIGWSGRVLAASLGELNLPNGKLLETERVEAELVGTSTLRLDLVRGRVASSDAPIVVLVGKDHEDVWLVTEAVNDLAMRVGTRAQRLGFYGPLLRFENALGAVAQGQRFEVRLRVHGPRATLDLNGAESATRAFTLGDGWRHYGGPVFDLRERLLSNWLWLAALLLPLGFFAQGRPSWAVALLLPIAALVILPALGYVGWSPVSEWFGAVCGIAAGSALGYGLRRLNFAQDS